MDDILRPNQHPEALLRNVSLNQASTATNATFPEVPPTASNHESAFDNLTAAAASNASNANLDEQDFDESFKEFINAFTNSSGNGNSNNRNFSSEGKET